MVSEVEGTYGYLWNNYFTYTLGAIVELGYWYPNLQYTGCATTYSRWYIFNIQNEYLWAIGRWAAVR